MIPLPANLHSAYIDGKMDETVFRMLLMFLTQEKFGAVTREALRNRFRPDLGTKSLRLLLQAHVIRTKYLEDLGFSPYVVNPVKFWNVDLILSGEPAPYPHPDSEEHLISQMVDGTIPIGSMGTGPVMSLWVNHPRG